ncbi:chloride channel protein [Candidatus Saccharibacteria bacterium]|nr:chloride channel protein [Candidatus Saccharibacteria bacterium]
MRIVKLAFGAVATGVGVALTYFVFETAVHESIDFVWMDVFNTDANWWLVPILCLTLAFVYFGSRHLLDPKSEKSDDKEALGGLPKVELSNYGKVIIIGYFSLLAGASLGPEAILIPSCMLVGALIAKNLLKTDKRMQGLLGLVGVASLFTAFFGSMFAGLLGLYLGAAEAKAKVNIRILIFAAIGIGSTYFVLTLLEPASYFAAPDYSWDFEPAHLVGLVFVFASGFALTWLMGKLETTVQANKKRLSSRDWKKQAIIAGGVLSILYIVGGPLVRFTGNQSIMPMINQASELGLYGLLTVAIIKIITIVWSKTSGYRGGLIFPTAFVASTATVICQLYVTDVSYIYGVIAYFIGAWLINRKTHVLF